MDRALGVFLLPRIKFAGIHLYTWVERGTVRVNCLAREHNTVNVPDQDSKSDLSLSGGKRAKQEAAVPLHFLSSDLFFFPFYKIPLQMRCFHVSLIALHVSFI